MNKVYYEVPGLVIDVEGMTKELEQCRINLAQIELLPIPKGADARLAEAITQYNEPLLGFKINTENRITYLETELYG